MARAHLKVTPELTEAFSDAQKSPVRLVRLRLDAAAEEVQLVSVTPPSKSLDDDLSAFAAELGDATDVALLCMHPDAATKKWVLVCYVPDTAPPRDKMLAASSRKDIRAALGMPLFSGEFHASVPGDLTVGAITETEEHSTALSEAEKAVKAERLESSAERGLKSAAMGVVHFPPTAELSAALDAFAAKDCKLLAAVVTADEALDVAFSEADVDRDTVGTRLPAEPRLVLIRLDDDAVFVLWCPEGSAPRQRMIYSTAKAAIVDLAAQRGVTFKEALQVREAADLAGELADAVTPAAPAPTPFAEGGGFARPARPGRGRARLLRKK